MKRIRRSSAAVLDWSFVLIGLVANQGATALSLIIIGRAILPTEFARYLASYELLSLIIVLPGYGLDVWLLTQGGASLAKLAALWNTLFRLRLRLLGLWIGSMLLLGLVLPAHTYPPIIFWATTFGLAFDSLILLAYSLLRVLSHHRWVALLQLTGALGLVGAALMISRFGGGIVLFALSRTALSALMLIPAIKITNRLTPASSELLPFRPLLKAARPFVIADGASLIYVKSDVSIISLVIGAGGTGIYGPALNLLRLPFLTLKALFIFIIPILSRLYTQSHRSFVRIGLGQLIIQSIIGLLISLLFYLFGPLITEWVFGPAYHLSGDILRLMSPIPLLRSLSFGLGAILASANLQRQRTFVQVLCALFNIIGNLIIIIPLGIVGVTIIYILSELLLAVGYALIVVIYGPQSKPYEHIDYQPALGP